MKKICLCCLVIMLSACAELTELASAPEAPIVAPADMPGGAEARPVPAPAPPPLTTVYSPSPKLERERAATTLTPANAGPGNAKFLQGGAAYQIPSAMVQDSPSPVDLWIEAGVSVDQIKSRLKEYLIENVERTAARFGRKIEDIKTTSIGTDIVGKNVLIGKKMFAELTGTGFEFDRTGPQEQAYIEGHAFQWSWLVTPKKPGTDLMLKLEVRADPGEGQTPVVVIREYVRVEARRKTVREWVESLDWWVKILTGGGISSLIALIYRRLRNKQDENQKPV